MSHVLIHAGTRADGAEEWSCPSCGRRLLFRWPPLYQRLVLDPGDARAEHVRTAPVTAPAAAPSTPTLTARDRSWLRAHGIEWTPAR